MAYRLTVTHVEHSENNYSALYAYRLSALKSIAKHYGPDVVEQYFLKYPEEITATIVIPNYDTVEIMLENVNPVDIGWAIKEAEETQASE